MRRPGSRENALPDLLGKWFGKDAGLPGTSHQVRFRGVEEQLTLEALPRMGSGTTKSAGSPCICWYARRGSSQGRVPPYIYCGDVEFVDWEGEKPITVRWRLAEALPQRLGELFDVEPIER